MLHRSFTGPLLALAACALVPASLARADVTALFPPAGAKVLFDGHGLGQWTRRGSHQPADWKKDGDAIVVSGADIQTRDTFQDFQLHLEFMTPLMPQAHGQARGNSGVFLQGRYEIQVLDSYGKPAPGTGDCGAVYSQSAALVNACRPPLEWQTYDIVFRAPRYADGKMTEKPRVTVFQNGILIQNNTEIRGNTADPNDRSDHSTPGPIILQNHGNPVKYRNIWIVPLLLKGSDKYE